ncbi:coatomer subunit zeta-2 [Corchorus olitorius]|uniref:Coatomer subunit zeta-2 n=1 Tax=Corchorus olitorius TaxID=93759 RepID=A0A1R3FUB2_9ROSI|nr:coatomer subunit zeta-2 [Corchorus olitorius]
MIPVDGKEGHADVCVIELGGTVGTLNLCHLLRLLVNSHIAYEENELISASVLQGLYDVVAFLLREALENLDLIFLLIDEIVDKGCGISFL